jgi:hypothetical protein
VELLTIVLGDVSTVVAEPPPGPISDRLFQRAYLDPTAEVAEREFQQFVHDDLVTARLSAFTTIVDALERAAPDSRVDVEVTVGPDEEMLWVTALNDARLVIGASLGVGPDDQGEYEPDDPRFELGVVYQWLSMLQGDLVDLLLDEMHDEGSDD